MKSFVVLLIVVMLTKKGSANCCTNLCEFRNISDVPIDSANRNMLKECCAVDSCTSVNATGPSGQSVVLWRYDICDPGWTKVCGSCFNVTKRPFKDYNWTTSHEACNVTGGRLASLNGEQMSFAVGELMSLGCSHMWIGLQRIAKKWVWQDGRDIPIPWHWSQPQNTPGEEVAMISGATDLVHDSFNYVASDCYICQKPYTIYL